MEIEDKHPDQPPNAFSLFKEERLVHYRQMTKVLQNSRIIKLISEEFKKLTLAEKNRYESAYKAEYENWFKTNQEYKKRHAKIVKAHRGPRIIHQKPDFRESIEDAESDKQSVGSSFTVGHVVRPRYSSAQTRKCRDERSVDDRRVVFDGEKIKGLASARKIGQTK